MRDTTPQIEGWGRFAWRVTAAHTATYLIAGLIASNLLDYGAWWGTEWMDHYRPLDSPWVAAGPALQPIRGLLFAAVLYPFRAVILGEGGWRRLWALLVGVGILSTYAAGPASVEGVIYTGLPAAYHLFGLPEVLGQTLVFSLCLTGWYRRPHRAWGLALGTITALALLASTAGLLFG